MIFNHLESWKTSKIGTNIKDGKLYFTMSQLMAALNMMNDVRNPHVTREISAILRKYGVSQYNSRKGPVPGVSGRYYSVDV